MKLTNKLHGTNTINDAPFDLYLRDFYLKDFKYISPQVIRVNNNTKAKRAKCKKDAENTSCKGLLKTWLRELMKGLKQFLYGGSLHGTKYIFEPSFSRKQRWTWIVIMVISVAMCGIYIIQLFCKWTSTPYVNVIDSLSTPVWAIPFPSVVLCPHIHVQLSYANVSELNGLNKFFASLMCPLMPIKTTARNQRMTADENKMLQDFIVKASPKCKDVVKKCYWRPSDDDKWGMEDCCDKLFKPVFTNYGMCFAFNRLSLNGMTNTTYKWQRTYDDHLMTQRLEWNLDTGYPKVFPPDLTTPPYRVMSSGETNGLSVELYLNNSDRQYVCDGNSLGFNVLISAPMDHIYTTTVLRLPMNRMTTVEVSPITYGTDVSLRSLTPGRRQCYFQDERKLEYFEYYTDSNCEMDLLIREARRICDCVLFNWPRKDILEPICSTLSDLQCIEDVKAKVEEQQIFAYYSDSEAEQRPSQKASTSCYPSCVDLLYSSQVYYSNLVLNGIESGRRDPKKKEVTIINVHFYDTLFLGRHRHAQYDEYYFVGAIGGLLSLFLGFSIISVVELVYFLILRPIHVVLREIYYSL